MHCGASDAFGGAGVSGDFPLAARHLVVFVSLRAILTMGYFADPAVLRALGIAPRAFTTPVCEADLLWPRVGQPRSTIRHSAGDVTPPGTPVPLGYEGELHADFVPRDGATQAVRS